MDCMQDSFARARTRPSARATIGYLVYNAMEVLPTSRNLRKSYLDCLVEVSC